MRKMIQKFILLTVSLIASLFINISVKAEENFDNLNNIEIMNEYSKMYKLTDHEYNTLLYKLNHNIPWDSAINENIDNIPEIYKYISLEEYQKGITSKIYRFEDGSIFSISINSEGSLPVRKKRSVTTYSSGSMYNQHLFTLNKGTQRAQMRISGWLGNPAYNSLSYINEAFGGSVSGFGTNGDARSRIIRKNENATQAALAELTWSSNINLGYSWAGFGGSTNRGTTCHMYVAFYKGRVFVNSTIPL